MIKNAYKRYYLKGAAAEAGIQIWPVGPALTMACLWWGRRPRVNWDCINGKKKALRKYPCGPVICDSQGLYIADDRVWPDTGCGCKRTVDGDLWGMGKSIICNGV